ncbi:hypothetical protein BLNAU_22346 [Blattamonas nauphoetae]|uniref:Uncharacterized protein n=1 Tax=Blattamonas nauphoetae TaxID=2049346 RepID=A0ABQ9WT83_9EUKA|nr:hypothetical protein BLNAU_22346 [Blattamonas nauphoetae]
MSTIRSFFITPLKDYVLCHLASEIRPSPILVLFFVMKENSDLKTRNICEKMTKNSSIRRSWGKRHQEENERHVGEEDRMVGENVLDESSCGGSVTFSASSFPNFEPTSSSLIDTTRSGPTFLLRSSHEL